MAPPLELLIPDLIVATLIIGVFWWRLGRVERRIEKQNSRIDNLETWKTRMEGFKEGIKSVSPIGGKDEA